MGMFIDAIKEIARLEMLLYVPPRTDISLSAVNALEKSYARRWNTDLRLFLCPRNAEENPSKWRRYGAGAFNFFKQGIYSFASGALQLEAFEARLQHAPDAVFAHRLPAMCPPLLTIKPLPPVFFDLDDIEHVSLMRSARREPGFRSRTLSYSYLPALLWGERQAIRLARETYVCSESDRRYLADRLRLRTIVTIPNAVTSQEAQPLTADPTLLFIGNFLYEPNVDAARFLIQQIWPRIVQAMPQARLIIAGNSPQSIGCSRNGGPPIEFTGFVDDLDTLYRRSRVVAVPVLSGAGTRVKIIEAAAYGKPIVATRIGAEGLEMRDGRELLLRDDAQSFAEACVTLLKDPDLCERLRRTAHTAALNHYDRRQVIQLIQKRLTACSNPHDNRLRPDHLTGTS